MKAQTSTALCINTLLVLNAGPGPAKLQPAPARCRSPPSTGQDQTDADGLTAGTNRCCWHLTGCLVAVAFGALQPVGFWMVLEGERKLPEPLEGAEPPSATLGPLVPLGAGVEGAAPAGLTRREPVPQPSAQQSLCPAACRIPSPVRSR